jgi:hypothetical protein
MGKGMANFVGSVGGGDGEEDDVFGDGIETPRNAGVVVDTEREREREFLEALRYINQLGIPNWTDVRHMIRSPDPESAAARASVGGWGLGGGHEDSGKTAEEDEEDEPLDWDQAQVCLLSSAYLLSS